MLPTKRPGRVLAMAATTAAAALLAVAPGAQAASRMTMTSSIKPNRGPIGSPINLKVGFTIDPATEGGPLDTIRRVVVLFPPNARHNAKFFPACTAAQINAALSTRACPRGSLIGRGSGRADVTEADVFNVPYTITFFNGSRSGNRITVHVYAERPVVINLAFEASLVKTSGRYGYRLTFDLPYALQEIYPSWFAQVRTLGTEIRAFTKVRGRRIPFIESTTLCPRSNFVPVASTYTFLDGSSTDVEARIACRR